MTIVYRDGPYAGQDDHLIPPPHRIGAIGSDGYYERTTFTDADGRLVYQWRPTVATQLDRHADTA